MHYHKYCGVWVHCVVYECTVWCMSALCGAWVHCVVYECVTLPLGLILCQKTWHSLVSPSPSSPPCRHRHADMALLTSDTRHDDVALLTSNTRREHMDIWHNTWWYGTTDIQHKTWWHGTMDIWHKIWWHGHYGHKTWWHDTLNFWHWHCSMSKLTFWLLTQPIRHQHNRSNLVELVDSSFNML